MVKGYVFYNDEKIPFVIENYRMELFSDEPLLSYFCKEYNSKYNYILHGQCFDRGFQGRKATFLVEHSMGNTCYLRCYIINMLNRDEEYDAIGLQSPFLDDVFRYSYNYIDMLRDGHNLGVEQKDVYAIPFSMSGRQYDLTFRIGHNGRLGLLEDFDRKGEVLIPIRTDDVLQECYDVSMVLYRLAMFMHSYAEVPLKCITLYKKGHKVGWFYCPHLSEDAISRSAVFFHDLDVMKYIPPILNNIALDAGSKITQSIPLGHLGNVDSMYSPQRFIEQVVAFEYLFDKLDPQNAKKRDFSLKEELNCMFNEFPKLLSNGKKSSKEVSEQIKELRRVITHGYAYYYDFKNDYETKRVIHLLDDLIKNMSLKWIGFSAEEIQGFNMPQ